MILPNLGLSNLPDGDDTFIDLEFRVDLDKALPFALAIEGGKRNERGDMLIQWDAFCGLTVEEASALRDFLDVALRIVERHKA